MNENFADYAHYYDLLYRDKNYRAEADYIADLILRHNPSVKSILEFGSGTGVHASLLSGKGFDLHGIERSQEMLNKSLLLANHNDDRSGRITFSQGDIREIRLSANFDAVIALFHVMSYQTTNEDVAAAFNTAREHLKIGGLFIFDIWYGPAVLTERPTVRIKRMADKYLSITRIAEPVLHENENLVDVNYQVFVTKLDTQNIRTLKETHVMRYFFKPELESISTHAGFELIHSEEWLTGASLSNATWGACFVLRG